MILQEQHLLQLKRVLQNWLCTSLTHVMLPYLLLRAGIIAYLLFYLFEISPFLSSSRSATSRYNEMTKAKLR